MDNRFEYALNKTLGSERERNGIGTLSERTLHAVLKAYFEPHSDSHEVKIGGFVADIVGEDGIIEIQTHNLSALRRKLDAFLSCTRVTVVYPLIAQKYIVWANAAEQRTRRRKSPKSQNIYDAFRELYGIRDYLANDRLTVHICLLQADEIRNSEILSKRRKRAVKADTVPTALTDEFVFKSLEDYRKLIPDGLPETFTSLTFAEQAGISRDAARHFLNTLTAPEIIKRVGKKGNNILFSVCR